jgi:hypothetical protein
MESVLPGLIGQDISQPGMLRFQIKPAVSSIEFCQSLFSEGDIGAGYCGGGLHQTSIPLVFICQDCQDFIV